MATAPGAGGLWLDFEGVCGGAGDVEGIDDKFEAQEIGGAGEGVKDGAAGDLKSGFGGIDGANEFESAEPERVMGAVEVRDWRGVRGPGSPPDVMAPRLTRARPEMEIESEGEVAALRGAHPF